MVRLLRGILARAVDERLIASNPTARGSRSATDGRRDLIPGAGRLREALASPERARRGEPHHARGLRCDRDCSR